MNEISKGLTINKDLVTTETEIIPKEIRQGKGGSISNGIILMKKSQKKYVLIDRMNIFK